MPLEHLRLKKDEDRRLRAGHLWIYSNEVQSPLKNFTPGQEVLVEAHDKTLLGIAYVNPHSLISARLLTRHWNETIDVDFFIRRIQTAYQLRARLFSKPYYRLVFGEGDFLPGLIVDRFGSDLAVQINTAGMEAKTEEIIAALRTVLPDTQSILLRNDSSTRQLEGLPSTVRAAFGTPPQQVSLEENNTRFTAPFWDGQKTGWFYDHRLNRAHLQSYVPTRRVLDVFSYLGAFGIQAATFGAEHVTCIDASPLSAEWIQTNAKLNGVENKVSVITDDAFVALKNLANADLKFAVIILDPPAFIKKQKDKKEGALAYQRINEMALKLLEPGGILVSCSCSMHMEYTDLVQALRRASLRTHSELQILERGHQGTDHPIHVAISETDYLKMIIARSTGK